MCVPKPVGSDINEHRYLIYVFTYLFIYLFIYSLVDFSHRVFVGFVVQKVPAKSKTQNEIFSSWPGVNSSSFPWSDANFSG